MPDNDVKENASKKAIGWTIVLMQGMGALFTGIMGVSFILLAFYLFYTQYRAAETIIQVKSLMMPMMNILISTMLLFYSRLLYFKAKATRRAIANGTFVSPRVIVTRYDIVAILAFILVVALISYFLIK